MDAGFTNAAQLRDMLNRSSPAASHAKIGSVLTDIITYSSYTMLSKAGLVIHGAGSTLVKAGSAFAALVNGTIIRKAANTDMAALSGTIANGQSGAFSFFINSSGTLSSQFGGAKSNHDAAIASSSLLATLSSGLVMIGIVVVDNASGSNFVGGTTALDTAGLTVTYYDIIDSPTAVGALGTR